MAIREVVRLGNPILRQVAPDIPENNLKGADLKQLIVDLIDTMRANDGVGLAATQIDEPVRVFVMDPAAAEADTGGSEPTVWINPRLASAGPDQTTGWEGCLSIPDLRGRVTRHHAVIVTGYDAQGRKREIRYEGFAAVVAQHEYDHLEGIVYLDRMTDFGCLAFVREFERYWLDPEPAAEG